MPLISVIIPTYNSRDTISRAIESILNQTFEDWELIIVNDGSEDDTSEVIQDFFSDYRITYFRQENKGVSAARNFGASLAKGKWLVFLDSDDELFPESLSEFVQSIQADDSIMLLKSGFLIKNLILDTLEERKAKKHIYDPPLPGTFMIERSLFYEIGAYNPNLKYSENTELFLRLSAVGIDPYLIESMSMIYYEKSTGGSKNLENMDQSISLILKMHSKSMDKIDNWNLFQTLGVVQLKLLKFSKARQSLLKSISFRPTVITTYIRFFLACLPFLSKKIYQPKSVNK